MSKLKETHPYFNIEKHVLLQTDMLVSIHLGLFVQYQVTSYDPHPLWTFPKVHKIP
jgi:hypothetical protein